MASTTQEKLFETFAEASGGQLPKADGSTAWLADVVNQLGALQKGGVVPAKYKSSAQTAASSGGASTPASAATSIASTFLKSGFGAVPLVSSLFGLFGGGGSPAAPTPLLKYALPASIHFQAAESGASIKSADYNQMGMPRAYGEGAATGTGPAQSSSDYAQTGAASVMGSASNGANYGQTDAATGYGGGAASGTGPGSNRADYNRTGTPTASGGDAAAASSRPAPQITVQVQAMDARSFMDHSNEIAHAVRDAMLNLNTINDVVNDL